MEKHMLIPIYGKSLKASTKQLPRIFRKVYLFPHLRVISITGGISSFFSSRKDAEASRIFLMTTWPDSTTVLHAGRKMTGNIH